jgi:hypothetical protein
VYELFINLTHMNTILRSSLLIGLILTNSLSSYAVSVNTEFSDINDAIMNSAPPQPVVVAPPQNYMACILTKWAMEYKGMIPLMVLMSYFTDIGSACSPTADVLAQPGVPVLTTPLSPVSSVSRYPGCDTDDIVLSNGQVWSACNVGATKAGTGVESYGSYFQWGRSFT